MELKLKKMAFDEVKKILTKQLLVKKIDKARMPIYSNEL
jgi:hypothetical protein